MVQTRCENVGKAAYFGGKKLLGQISSVQTSQSSDFKSRSKPPERKLEHPFPAIGCMYGVDSHNRSANETDVNVYNIAAPKKCFCLNYT